MFRPTFLAPLAILALLGSSSLPALAAMTETLSPTVGPPTTTVAVALTGFTAGAAVDIFFDTTDMCLTIADATGHASCAIKVPGYAQPTQHYVTGLQQSNHLGVQKAFLVQTDMAQFHGRGATHAGVNPYENTIDVFNAGGLNLLWRRPIGPHGSFNGSVVAGGKVYVAGTDGNLYAFNAGTGAPIAGFPVAVGGQMFASPAVGGGRVFVGAADNKLHAYNAATGAVISGFPKILGGVVNSSPALALGNVYVGCDNGDIYAFNATTGAAVTGFPKVVGGAFADSPTIFDGKLYIGSSNHNVYGFDALTGAAIGGFPYAAGAGVEGTVAAAGGIGFVGAVSGFLLGFALDDGHPIATFPKAAPGPVFASPAVYGGKVIMASADGSVTAYRTNDGTQVWNTVLNAGAGGYGAPMIANGIVYVSDTYQLHALALSNGQPLWSAAGRTGGRNGAVVSDGIVYFADGNTAGQIGHISAYSINGDPPAAHLPGGNLGVAPAFSALKPDPSLRPATH